MKLNTTASTDGAIRFDTEPQGLVLYIDGNEKGLTDIDITDVQAGEHSFSLIFEGDEYTGGMWVFPEKMTHVFIDLLNAIRNDEILDIASTQQYDVGLLLQKLDELNDSILKVNKGVNTLVTNEAKKTVGTYEAHNTITTAVLLPQPDNLGAYQYDNIHNVLEANAPTIYVLNHGPGIAYFIYSQDGIHYTNELFLLEGEYKAYHDVYSIGARSPVSGLTYHVSERYYPSNTSERFRGSRFKDRRDRKGVINYHDDMESPTVKYVSLPGAGTIARSNAFAYSGDFSTKIITDAVGGNSSIVYTHPDFHFSRIGAQIRFLPPGAAGFNLSLITTMTTGTVQYTGTVVVQSLIPGLFGSFSVGGQVQTPGGQAGPISFNPGGWNTLKLVIDPVSGFYFKASLNSYEFNATVQNIPLIKAASTANKTVTNTTTVNTAPGGGSTFYFDDYIMTEDEEI